MRVLLYFYYFQQTDYVYFEIVAFKTVCVAEVLFFNYVVITSCKLNNEVDSRLL